MHSVIVLADHHLSYAAMSETSHPPIGPYPRAPVEIHDTDPHAAEVAGRLVALIAASWPGVVAEHVGSSAVPGLAGKGIIDLLCPPTRSTSAASPRPWSDSASSSRTPRPSPRPGRCCGVLRHGSTDYRVHVHVVPNSSPEVAAMRGFRDALCADPALRHRSAALKWAIVAGGPVDPMTFTKAKHDWITPALGQFGLPGGRRLYQTTRPGQPQLLAIDRGRRCLTGVALPAVTARPGRSGLPRFDLGCKSRLDHRPGSHVTSEGLLSTQGPTGFRQVRKLVLR